MIDFAFEAFLLYTLVIQELLHVKSLRLCPTLCNSMDCSPPGSVEGCHFLLQGIFLTQGSNPSLLCLLHWQAGSLPLVPPGKARLRILYIFSQEADDICGKESTCNAGDPSSIFGSGRSAGERIGYPLQFSWASLVAQLVKNLLQCWRPGLDSWVGKIPWRGERLPTSVFWPRELHGQHSPWGRKELDMTEQHIYIYIYMYTHIHTYTHIHI